MNCCTQAAQKVMAALKTRKQRVLSTLPTTTTQHRHSYVTPSSHQMVPDVPRHRGKEAVRFVHALHHIKPLLC